MKKRINLHKKEVEYTLKMSRRARRMRLAVYGGGNFVVTAPYGMEQSFIERFILKKARWVMGQLEYFKTFGGVVLPKSGKREYRRYHDKVLALATERVQYFNALYCFKFNKITIKDQKTRWGSCSKKGNLNFNYKIVFLSSRLSDYIIVHELCHLSEFNHSQKFWNLVAKALPDYSEIRGALKKGRVGF